MNVLAEQSSYFRIGSSVFRQVLAIFVFACLALPFSPANGANSCFSTHLDSKIPSSRPASQRLSSQSVHTKKFWRNYERLYKVRLEEYFVKRLDIYLAAKKLEHPQIKFLESMGFHFHEKYVVIPSLERVMNSIESRIDDMVHAGHVKESEVLRPMLQIRVKISDQRKILDLQYGEKIPSEVGELSISMKKEDRTFQDTGDFATTIKNGRFPLAGLESANGVRRGDGLTGLQHDLAHFGAFLEFPEYMKALRKNYTEMADKNASAGMGREFMAVESAFVLRKANSQDFADWLGLPFEYISKPSYLEILKFYESLNSGQLQAVKSKMIRDVYKYAVPLGGGTRDIISPLEFSSMQQMPLEAALKLLEYDHDGIKAINPAVQILKNSDVQNIANFAHMMVTSKEVSSVDWANIVTNTDISENPLMKSFGPMTEPHFGQHPMRMMINLSLPIRD